MARQRVKTDAFAFVLRELRREKRLSQDSLALRLEVSRPYISYLENGTRYPSLEMLIALAGALEIRPGDLLDRVADRLASGKASPLVPAVIRQDRLQRRW